MPKFAANLSMLFTELPVLDRFAAAARAGFEAVEIQFPYECSIADLRSRIEEHDLQLVLHNLPAGDWVRGDRGLACRPERRDEFRAGVARAVRYATALGCLRLNCLAGIAPEDVALARATLIDNLRYAADALADAGLRLLVEPLNSVDVPDFFLTRSNVAIDVVDEVGAPNVFLQFDAYHMQMMGEDLLATVERHLARIDHIQVADAPGRHEPGTGGIDFDAFFKRLDTIGYRGWVGCEYRPQTNTLDGLEWLGRFQQGALQP